MATNVTVGGIVYAIPAYGDAPSTGWGTTLSNFFIAVAANIATSPTFMQFVAVSASPQSIVTGKTYLVDSTATAITLNLPAAAANSWFIVKDVGFNAFTNNITIHRAGSESIDGVAADFVISNSGAAWIFMSNGTNWFSVASVYDIRLKDQADGNIYKLFMNNGNLQWSA